MQEAAAQLMRGLIEAFILESLAREPKHGYALLKELEEVFGDEPNRNRIYPLLSKLEDQGVVEGQEVPGSSRGKIRYQLTEDGHARLRAYKRMPAQFREAVLEMWGGVPAAEGAAGAAAAVVAEERAPTRAREGGEEGGGGGEAPAPAPPAPDGDKPYPCPDARLSLEKSARTGDIEMKLRGCPMGAYSYCPQCPVFASVQGLRRLLFG